MVTRLGGKLHPCNFLDVYQISVSFYVRFVLSFRNSNIYTALVKSGSWIIRLLKEASYSDLVRIFSIFKTIAQFTYVFRL